VARLTQLRFAGLQAFQGRAQHAQRGQRRSVATACVQSVRATCERIQAAGLGVPLVTGGGTGTLVHEAASGVGGELQAGTFLFMDADYARNEREPAQPAFEHALYVKTQVISRQGERAVCDAGHTSHAIDAGVPWVACPKARAWPTTARATSTASSPPKPTKPRCPPLAACCGWCPATATLR
jgi:D-serine deaminase-like pyridoxal phosphate-dependent protein